MDFEIASNITTEYLKHLELVDKRKSAWSENKLPFAKSVIKDALHEVMLPLRHSLESKKQELISAYVALAHFVPADDAQLVKNCESQTVHLARKMTTNVGLSQEDGNLITAFERSYMRIRQTIEREERHLFSKLASLNQHWLSSKPNDGINPSNSDSKLN